MKILGARLPGVVNHKVWHNQLCEHFPHMPVHHGGSPQMVVVAQEVDGFVVLLGDDLPDTRICIGHIQSASCQVPWA